ncbi:hypothetical protein Agub_g11866 [Astrephomene gubernaculifera]|uniref:DNA-directed RNA polymerase III subunit n=1 Tax=Astrephomene gubernaculifera TaxID=47775 RepID=A0AAD3DYS8_9CHLO|nr:hypothetical protein Agub_g11866 [Astrephomene gubernaculifera]
MSGRGGRGFGRGGGRGGFGGRGGPMGPVARDEDGTVLPTAPAGPPPLFPEVELPEHPDITARDKMLLLRRFELTHRSKASPYFLELPKAQQDTGTLAEGFDPFKQPEPGAAGAAGGAATAGAAAVVGVKRSRPPLSSVLTLVPEYFPEELYSSKDMRASRLQTLKGQDAYFRAQNRGDDAAGLNRLEQLARLEGAAEEGGGRKAGGEGEEEEAADEEEVLHDTDEEEDMEDDDYYQGEHFDDDEGYGDAFEDGGDEGPVY